MTPGQRAEARIAELGIRDARDIDVEAIACDAQMAVEYRHLDGCEATLAGFEDRAIATIKRSPIRGRERFSIGHELGHWDMHRGKSFRCRVDEPDQNLTSDLSREKQADEYAAHLLMPSALFNPAVKSRGAPGFREIEGIASDFETSILATSIRLADINTLPVILACYTSGGLKWRKQALDVPRRWWLRSKPDDDSFAHDLFSSGKRRVSPGKQPAEVWFENSDADNYEVSEDCMPGRTGEVLVLIYLTPRMLDAGFDPDVGARRYTDNGSYVTRK